MSFFVAVVSQGFIDLCRCRIRCLAVHKACFGYVLLRTFLSFLKLNYGLVIEAEHWPEPVAVELLLVLLSLL